MGLLSPWSWLFMMQNLLASSIGVGGFPESPDTRDQPRLELRRLQKPRV